MWWRRSTHPPWNVAAVASNDNNSEFTHLYCHNSDFFDFCWGWLCGWLCWRILLLLTATADDENQLYRINTRVIIIIVREEGEEEGELVFQVDGVMVPEDGRQGFSLYAGWERAIDRQTDRLANWDRRRPRPPHIYLRWLWSWSWRWLKKHLRRMPPTISFCVVVTLVARAIIATWLSAFLIPLITYLRTYAPSLLRKRRSFTAYNS